MNTINLSDTNYFSSLMLDYVNQVDSTKDLYHRYPEKSQFLEQAKEKLGSYKNREVLVNQITQQMSNLNLSKKQKKNLDLLSRDNTVTITTGHQLNLFTGPIFFFYKILQIIKQCKELNKSQNEFNYVPVFWMATEDHDFEEINHFKYQDRVIHWEHESGGPVGRLDTDGLTEVFDSYLSLLPNGIKKDSLRTLIELSYKKANNLTDATRRLVHLLFREYGLIILDGDDKELKKLMISTFKDELIHKPSFDLVNKQSENLNQYNYKIQVHPREINLFYINEDNSRERIVYENEFFYVLNTDLKFSQEEILNILENYPEKFSPNVILRPLYQETILPNIAYVGGGGEIAYWLELKSMFNYYKIDFPILVLRNSLLLRTNKQLEKQKNLKLTDQNLFEKSLNTVKNITVENSELINKLPALKAKLTDLFDELNSISNDTDPTFANMVAAQRAKQLKGFEKLEKRLLKAEVKQNKNYQDRVDSLLKSLNQENGLQERKMNFSDFDFVNLDHFIEDIYKSIQPFEFNFIIITLDESI